MVHAQFHEEFFRSSEMAIICRALQFRPIVTTIINITFSFCDREKNKIRNLALLFLNNDYVKISIFAKFRINLLQLLLYIKVKVKVLPINSHQYSLESVFAERHVKQPM